MNTKKHYLILMLVFLFLLLGTTISYGAYSASSSTVNSGEKITVKVTSSEALEAYNLDLQSHEGLTFNSCSKTESGAIININGSSIGYMNMSGNTKDLGIYTFTAPKVTEDKKYTITFMVDKKTSVTSTITVKAPVVETPPTTTTPEPEKPSTNTNTGTGNSTTTTKPVERPKSSETRLKNFGIKPSEYDFSGFSKNPDKEEWSAEVPNRVTSVEVYAEPVDNKAKVSGDGKVTLNEGNNKIGVKVTAEDGKTKTYTLTIKRKTVAEEEAENGENRLKSLSIKPKEYDFTGFDSETTEYTAEVPNEVEQIEISATAMDSKAQITGTGIIDLEEGENELKVEVIAVNGDKKTYTLTVTRKEAEAKEAFGLTTLSINGLKLTPSFKTDIYEYTAELEEDLTALEITTKATSEDATVEIVGNENLQDGENVITILVENEETEEVATYQITVNKLVVAEIVEKTSWLKPSTWGKEEIIKIIIIVVLIILIICAVILKKNISKESPKSKKMDLPGAEELDKAIAEHQELVDSDKETVVEEMDITENVNQTHEEHNYIEEIAKNKFEVEDFDDKPKRRGRHF